MTDVTDCGEFQERGRTTTHSEHANTGLPKSVHLHYTQGGLLTSAAVQTLLQGADLLLAAAPNEQQCKLRWVSVPTQQLSPFYLLSTRDVSRVISFTMPSSRLFFRVKGQQRERTAWVRG